MEQIPILAVSVFFYGGQKFVSLAGRLGVGLSEDFVKDLDGLVEGCLVALLNALFHFNVESSSHPAHLLKATTFSATSQEFLARRLIRCQHTSFDAFETILVIIHIVCSRSLA